MTSHTWEKRKLISWFLHFPEKCSSVRSRIHLKILRAYLVARVEWILIKTSGKGSVEVVHWKHVLEPQSYRNRYNMTFPVISSWQLTNTSLLINVWKRFENTINVIFKPIPSDKLSLKLLEISRLSMLKLSAADILSAVFIFNRRLPVIVNII